MADWSSFLRSDEFRLYRKKQVYAVADHIKKATFQLVSNGEVNQAALKGKMEMISIFLRLPETLTQDTKLKELLTIQLDEDVSNITKYLIRQSLNE